MSIEVIQHEHWCEITIDRAEKKNALSLAMWQTLHDAFTSLASDSEMRLLVLQGQSGSFSAGADIGEFSAQRQNKDWLKKHHTLIKATQQALECLPMPTIAFIDGACYGGGCGLALACDYRLASTQSVFAIGPVKLGLLYSLEDTQRLVNIVGMARAKQMLLGGQSLAAETALQWGLISELCPTQDLPQRQQALLETWLSYPHAALRGIKQTFKALARPSEFGEVERQRLQQCFDAAFDSVEHIERIKAFRNT